MASTTFCTFEVNRCSKIPLPKKKKEYMTLLHSFGSKFPAWLSLWQDSFFFGTGNHTLYIHRNTTTKHWSSPSKVLQSIKSSKLNLLPTNNLEHQRCLLFELINYVYPKSKIELDTSYILKHVLYITKTPIVFPFPDWPPNACWDNLPSLLIRNTSIPVPANKYSSNTSWFHPRDPLQASEHSP